MDKSWDRWFDSWYDTHQDIKRIIDERTEGKSNTFKVAVIMGIIESLSEMARTFIDLPAPDAVDVDPE